MSQPIPQPQFVQPAPYVMMPANQGNGLGVFGFVVALVGLVIPTGIVSILGLMLSLVAVGRAPRGFAAMGVILGLLGSVVWLIISVVAIVAAIAVGLVAAVGSGAMFMMSQPEAVEVTTDMANVVRAVHVYRQDEDRLPGGLNDLHLSVATRTDPWGNGYRFEPVDGDPGFEMLSAGPDGQFGNTDDIAMSRLDRMWENAFERFTAEMETIGDQLESMERSGDLPFAASWNGQGTGFSFRCSDRAPRCAAQRRGGFGDYESRAERSLASTGAGDALGDG